MKKTFKGLILTILFLVILSIHNINVFASIQGVISGSQENNVFYNPITLTKGDSIYFYLSSSESGYSSYSWASSNTSVVKCESSSKYYTRLEAVGTGMTSITVYKRQYSYQTGQYTLIGMSSISVTVTEPELISINLSYPEVYLDVGETLQNSVSGWYPAGAEIGEITWSSNNSNIAKVSLNGLITGVSEGTTTIYARANGKTASCSVTVSANTQDDETGSEEVITGTAGDNISWEFKNGVLTFTGTGSMNDYNYAETPWESIKEEIKSIVIDDGIIDIGNYTFINCKNLTSVKIPDSVTSVGSFAFKNCDSLTSVKIPDGVTSIGYSAFYYCSNLTTVNIPDGVRYINGNTFSYCSSLTSVEIPNSVISIGNDAFNNCDSLTSIKIPDSVTSIGDHAFNHCDNLTSIEISNSITTIESYMFNSCKNLTSVEIPDNITSIEESAFNSCKSLTTVKIPDRVTSIGNLAFISCTGLKSVEIPDSVKSIGDKAFYNCTGLSKVTYLGSKSDWNAINIGTGNEYLTNAVTFPANSVTLNKDKITLSVGQSSSLIATVSPDYATNQSVTWSSSNTKVATVSGGIIKAVGQGTTTITVQTQDGGYKDTCTVVVNAPVLQKVSTPVTNVSAGNINKGTNVSLSTETAGATIYYTTNGSAPTTSSTKYTNPITVNDDITIKAIAVKSGMENSSIATFKYTILDTVTYYIDNGVLTISGSGDMDDYEVTSDIPWYSQRLNINKIIISNGITSIGTKAFYGCINATIAEIPETVIKIGENAFKNCDEISIVSTKGSYAEEYAYANNIPFIDSTPPEPLEDLSVELAETPSRWYFDISSDTYTNNAIVYVGIYDSNNKLLAVGMADMVESDITSVPILKVSDYSYAKIFEWVNMNPVTNFKLIPLNQ